MAPSNATRTVDGSPVLIIDDDADVLGVIAGTLRAAGYSAMVAADARQAAVLLRCRPFAVIITDVVMPHLTGLEVLDLAKRHCPTAEVLLLTAYATPQLVTEAIVKGAGGVIEKPFDREHLLGNLREALRRARLRAQLHESGATARKVSNEI